MTSKLPVLLLCALASPFAMAGVAPFIGHFTPGNWTFANSNINSDGSIILHDSSILIFKGGDNSESGSTNVTITAPSSGTVSFDWSFDGEAVSGSTGPQYDPFGYVTGLGGFVQLTDDNGAQSQFGSASFAVNFGDFLGFSVYTFDGTQGPGVANITNFSFTPGGPDVPFGVDSTLGLGLLGAAAAFKFRRRRKA